MEELINKALALTEDAASKYEAEDFLYEVVVGTDRERLTTHGSLENFCEKCIEDAVRDKKRQFFIDRQQFMGKIYEYQQKGYYIEPNYRWDKESGKATGLILRKVQNKKYSKDQVIKNLNSQLKKKYPASMIFSSQCYNASCSEHDGFELCDNCGVIFSQALLLTDQELEHWETGVEDSDLRGYIIDPYHAYQLNKILDCYNENADYCEYQLRLIKLAERIVSVTSQELTIKL